MAYSGTNPARHLLLPPVSPRKHHTAFIFNQTQTKVPLVPPNKPNICVGMLEQQKQERSTPGEMKRKVELIWRKQQDTMNDYVTYFDNLDGPCQLLWDKLSTHYSTTADLTCGQHMGCLALSDRDLTSETQNFLVLENSLEIQLIIISVNTPDVKERVGQRTTNPKLGEKKKEGGELRQLREERKTLEKDNSMLRSKLEEQKKESNSQLDKYKKENLTLRAELDKEKQARERVEETAAGDRNQARITQLKLESQLPKVQPSRVEENMTDIIWRTLESPLPKKQVTDSQTSKGTEYINFEIGKQFSEYYIEYKELEKSKEALKNDKQKVEKESAKFLDLLHAEKISLTKKLSQTKKLLADSEKEIARLNQILSDSTVSPRIPPRSHLVFSPFSNSNHS